MTNPATQLLQHVPPEDEIRREISEKLREVAALKELLRIAIRRGKQKREVRS